MTQPADETSTAPVPQARHVRAAELDGSVRAAGRLVCGAVFEAGQEADRLLVDAKREADAVLTDASREADRIRREAAASAHRLAGDEVARLIALLDETRSELCRDTERELIDLATSVAQRILHRELDVNPAVVAELVAAALIKLRGQPLIVVHVHPHDLEQLTKHETELVDLLADGAQLELEADESVPRSGCRVETAAGTIDATLESLRRAMRTAHASPPTDRPPEPSAS